jgi:putative ABC transport system substrate-binding protein
MRLGYVQVMGFLLLLAGGLLTTDSVRLSASMTTILLVNSDASISRYRETEAAFRESLPGTRIVAIDLEQTGESTQDLDAWITRERPDLLYFIGSKAYELAGGLESNLPVIFSSVINWERFPHRENTFGISNDLALNQSLSLLKFIFPNRPKVGVLYDREYNQALVEEAIQYSKELGVTLITRVTDSRNPNRILDTFESLLDEVDLVWVIPDPGILMNRDQVADLFQIATESSKPVVAYSRVFIPFGASLILSPDIPTTGRQAANFSQLLLGAAKPSTPVLPPAGSDIILNACQLERMKVDYNQDSLDSVSQLVRCEQK